MWRPDILSIIEGWCEVIYYELHNTNCRHPYNQTVVVVVVVVPEFALPVELLCWQFNSYPANVENMVSS
jgi:hypothetical protein